ncbi:acetyl-CoA carboxylase biotin carboxyl carrier protein subunit [Mesorhizobium sp. CAU 1732]|uniref:acetyl-CoA carboxylase biotin carboxyl carrier protein subunit n=1 Tax=Mesorhizobium sp. CAU 1732 TaxID=3140358 RepID=UPI0032602A00
MAISIKSEIAGVVDAIEKHEGDTVAEGDEVIILSSMKMEIPVVATASGRIGSIAVSTGETVTESQLLFTIET